MRSSVLPRIVIGLSAALVLLYAGSLLFDPSQTRLVIWPRDWTLDLRRLAPFAAALGLYFLMGHLMFQHATNEMSRRRAALALAALFVAGCGLQIAATAVPEVYPLRGILERQYSQFTGGYFSVGARVDSLGDFLADYARLMPSFPIHPRSHPPGLPLLFWAGTRLAGLVPGLPDALAPALRPLACFDEQSAALGNAAIAGGLIGGLVEMALANLAIVPLFLLVKRLSDTRSAVLAAILYPLTACALMWVSRFDRIYPVIAVCGVLLCEQILQSRRRSFARAAALGLLLALATFLTYGNLPMILLCAVYFVGRAVQLERLSNWRLRLAQGLVMAAAFAVFWLAWVVFAQFDLLSSFKYGASLHFDMDRPYWPWVFWHAWDIFTFIGLPVCVIALIASWKSHPALALAFAGPIVFMCAFYIARDETGRIWMYFAPLAVALAALYIARKGTLTRSILLGLLGLQVFVQVSLLRVISYGIDPATLADAVPPAGMTASNVRYGDNGEIRLLGYEITGTLKPGQVSTLALYWQLDSSAPISSSYKVFLHIADTLDDQARIVNQDWKPLNWGLPTTCWRPGMILRDAHDFTVDPNSPPGGYVALVGLYQESANRRAFVHTADVARNGAVMLPTPIQVMK